MYFENLGDSKTTKKIEAKNLNKLCFKLFNFFFFRFKIILTFF